MFDQSTKQEEIFENVAHGVIDKYTNVFVIHLNSHASFSISPHSCLEGYNGTIFAYGQVKSSLFRLMSCMCTCVFNTLIDWFWEDVHHHWRD